MRRVYLAVARVRARQLLAHVKSHSHVSEVGQDLPRRSFFMTLFAAHNKTVFISLLALTHQNNIYIRLPHPLCTSTFRQRTPLIHTRQSICRHTMADQDITAAMSALAVSDTPPPPPPRPNFPLPRELRDQIYGYLLDNKYTRVKRTYDPDSDQANSENGLTAYHFHTNILGVNHAIHDEAEKLLYERNVFVVASYTCPQFSSVIRSLKYVRMVSMKHVARMKHHSLRIHFKGNNVSTDQGIDSVLLVANQMTSFCRVLEGRLIADPSRSVSIGTIRDTSKHRIRLYNTSNATNSKSPRLMCELRNTEHRAVTHELQSSLLSPLASVICDTLAVSFRGDIFNFEEIFELKKTMVPSLFSRDARNWARQ